MQSQPTTKFVLVGNKKDIPSSVNPELIDRMRMDLCASYYCEVSAKTGDGIDDLFEKVVEMAKS